MTLDADLVRSRCGEIEESVTCFGALQEAGLLPGDLAGRLRRMKANSTM